MAKELLDLIKRHTILNQPACKGVAEAVGVEPVVIESGLINVIPKLVGDPPFCDLSIVQSENEVDSRQPQRPLEREKRSRSRGR